MALEPGIDLLEDQHRSVADRIEHVADGAGRCLGGSLAGRRADREHVRRGGHGGGDVGGPPRDRTAQTHAGEGHRAVQGAGEIVRDDQRLHASNLILCQHLTGKCVKLEPAKFMILSTNVIRLS
jgi:hypothetical protein